MELNLGNLGSGAANEKWQEEMAKVVENILDPNTDAIAKRKVTLEVTLMPNKDRNWVDMKIETSSKLAPTTAYTTRAFVGADKRTGQIEVFEDNPNQVTIQDFIEQKQTVTDIRDGN